MGGTGCRKDRSTGRAAAALYDPSRASHNALQTITGHTSKGDGLVSWEVAFARPGHKVPGALIDRGHMIDAVFEEVTFGGAHHAPIVRPIVSIARGTIHGDGVATFLSPPPVRVFAPSSFLGLGVPGLREGSRDRLDDLIHLPRRLPLPSQEEFQRLENLAQVGLLLVSTQLDIAS
jgi:hypothetical protein